MQNGEGQTLDRWVGYSKSLLKENMEEALSDLTTIESKRQRYTENPDAKLASALGRYSYAVSEYSDAVKYYENAQKMKTDPKKDYSYNIFTNMQRCLKDSSYTFDNLGDAARNVVNSDVVAPNVKVYTITSYVSMAQKRDKLDVIEPFIESGLKLVEGKDDDDSKEGYNELMIQKALYVTHDDDTAVKFKKASMPEGWMEDAGELNSFAWWCFENMIDLEEAQQMARKGVELAEPGKSKAMILDTLAEICNVLDNCSEAVELEKQAVQEDPDSKFYKEQVDRFEKILASK